MKTLHIYLSILILSLTTTLSAQTVETSFEVKGVCDMCKDRIEETALRQSGVKFATWDEETQKVTIAYKANKITEDDLHAAIANSGHATSKVDKKKEAYESLPACCQYESGHKCGHSSEQEKH